MQKCIDSGKQEESGSSCSAASLTLRHHLCELSIVPALPGGLAHDLCFAHRGLAALHPENWMRHTNKAPGPPGKPRTRRKADALLEGPLSSQTHPTDPSRWLPLVFLLRYIVEKVPTLRPSQGNSMGLTGPRQAFLKGSNVWADHCNEIDCTSRGYLGSWPQACSMGLLALEAAIADICASR